MPEASRIETLTHPHPSDHMTAHRKSSNMSTNSDDSLRKISNDSGIGINCSQGVRPSARIPNNYDELIGEPRLATDLSTAMLFAQQQSLSAAAALNPAMLGLMSASLFANPLATAMLQQEANTRKLLETAGSGKGAVMGAGKGYTREQLSMYPGIAGIIPPPVHSAADQLALSDALRGQLLSRKLSEEVHGANGGVTKPTRKANSFSGTSSSPLHRQFSPPTSNTVSPNLNHNLSPNDRNITGNSGDEQQCSPYRDDDSAESSKSSVRSHTPQPSSQLLDSQPSMTAAYGGAADMGLTSASVLNSHQFHPSSRRRKNGIIGSMQMSELNSYSLGAYPSQPTATNDIPMHKLSTASLPATLPSNSQRVSLVHDPLSNRGSPATSRKRQRIQVDEKVGSRREDESYWERRRKNNEAAKRSRDSRRAKEDEIAIRAAFLEQENFKLRLELNKLKEEHSKLQTEMENRRKSTPVDRGEVDDTSATSRSTAAESSQPPEECGSESAVTSAALPAVIS